DFGAAAPRLSIIVSIEASIVAAMTLTTSSRIPPRFQEARIVPVLRRNNAASRPRAGSMADRKEREASSNAESDSRPTSVPPGPGDGREHVWLQINIGPHRTRITVPNARDAFLEASRTRPIVFSPLIGPRCTVPQPMQRVFMEGNAGGKRCANNSMTRGLDAFFRDWVVFQKRGTEGRGTVASSQGDGARTSQARIGHTVRACHDSF